MARAVRISNRRTLLKVKQTFQGYFLEKEISLTKKYLSKLLCQRLNGSPQEVNRASRGSFLALKVLLRSL